MKLLAGVLSAWLVLLFPSTAAAEDCHYETVTFIDSGMVVTQTVKVCDGTETTPVVEGQPPPTDSGLDSICVATAISAGEDIYAFCGIPPGQPIVLTPDMIRAALARTRPPQLPLQVQPPNGRTLVNFDTNFYVEPTPFETALDLLGQRVDLRLTPSTFTWHFGDGEAATTDRPGAPYPALDVTHRYLRKGQVAPSVDTTWTATYRVNGGPWAPIPGTVTVTGEAVDLRILTATPTLVG